MSALRAMLRRALPRGSQRRAVAELGREVARDGAGVVESAREHWVGSGIRVPQPYWWWLRNHQASPGELRRQREAWKAVASPVAVHLVVVGTGVEPTVASFHEQTWGTWTVTAADTDLAAGIERALQNASDRDLVIICRAGDRLAPDSLFEVARVARRDPLVDVVHWDDDAPGADGKAEPRFRPSWSPDLLLGANYLHRSFAVRARALRAAGPLRSDDPDLAEWDLLLGLDLEPQQVERVPRVLEHLAARDDTPPSGAAEMVAGHLARRGRPARVEHAGPGLRIRWALEPAPSVTVVIPTKHNREQLGPCLAALGTTEYDGRLEVVVVDNGGRTEDNERWYDTAGSGLDLQVEWWEEPFNYSAVNNAGAALGGGEVLVFLNDDAHPTDPAWLAELVGWAQQPDVGVVGAQLLDGDGRIQHGGVVVGMHGFADHLFAGMEPGSASLVGPTDWYRNLLASTAACVAVGRDLFDEIGGFDERFVLCGSDVVLGLDAVLAGRRNVCTPFAGVRHAEGATRGSNVPQPDFFASYWRYQSWLFGGDPYWSPNLSLESGVPALRAPGERSPGERLEPVLGRSFRPFRQTDDPEATARLVAACDTTEDQRAAVDALHAANGETFEPRTVTWFVPDIDSPFYGGINTVLRLADHLARVHGVQNQFAVGSPPNELWIRSAVSAAFPRLSGSRIAFYDELDLATVEDLPETDVAVATLWLTAHAVARFPGARRKCYAIQDFEPMFYPAGSLYAVAEDSYTLGLYGLCNTGHLLHLYREQYGGAGVGFWPAVDGAVFHAEGRRARKPEDPVTVFAYARPGHWRNCWEIAEPALREVKERLGDRVRIVTAGSWAAGASSDDITHLGLLDYRATGDLYRTCDVGVTLTVSEHPSYLPLELMACGVATVAFDNPAGSWIQRHDETSLLARRTVPSLAANIERLVLDDELRSRLMANGLRAVAERHADWDEAFAPLWPHLCNPEGDPPHPES